MPQKRSTAFQRNQKKERRGTKNDKTNATYETTPKKRSATKEPPWNGQYESYRGVGLYYSRITLNSDVKPSCKHCYLESEFKAGTDPLLYPYSLTKRYLCRYSKHRILFINW